MTPIVRAGVAALWVCGLLVLLCWTLFNDAPRLMGDFPTDTWYVQHQADSLRQGYLPSHLIHADVAVFYPTFAFYGGTLFAFAGAVALIVGSAATAQIVLYVLALGAAYGGWLWLARIAGLRSWQAHVPAVLYVTTPYVMTNLYVRQDLTESVATASIPLLLASALSVLRADRLRAGPFAALAASTIAFGGSHNLTLLWATTILGLTALALVAAVPQARRMVTRPGVLRVLAVLVPAMAVNAWYLLPDLVYQSHTVIAQRIDEWRALVLDRGPVLDARYLYALGRPSGLHGSGLTVTLPMLVIAWLVIAAVTVRRQWGQAWARTLAVLSLASIVVLVMMTHPRLITLLPDPWVMIQFSYRLETFVLFGICGAVIAALVLLGRGDHRRLSALLIPIAAFSIVGAAGQMHGAHRFVTDIGVSMDHSSVFGVGDFADADLRLRSPPPIASVLKFTRADVKRDRIDINISATPGQVVYTNLMAPSRMIDVQGAHVIGSWIGAERHGGWQPLSFLVVQFDKKTTTPGKAHLVVREARTLPIVGGRILSILGLLGLAANGAVIARASRRRRREG